MSNPRVTIIILNWNGWEDTVECLESIFQIDYHNFVIIVVDNASEDDSIENIRQYCNSTLKVNSKFFNYSPLNKPIELFENTNNVLKETFNLNTENFVNKLFLIKNSKNYGFAKGNNIGIEYAINTFDPDYVLLLNNDTVVDKEFLRELVLYVEENQNVGVIGPKIYYYDHPDKIQVATTKIDFWTGRNSLWGDGEVDHGQYDNISVTDYVSGACFLVKREIINKLGFLDSNFVCYWEETDYCTSVRRNGYQCIYNPNSFIWHKVSKSTDKFTGISTFYMTRNMFWFMQKHADKLHYFVFIMFYFGLKFWYVVINLVIKKDFKDISYFISGVKAGLIGYNTIKNK